MSYDLEDIDAPKMPSKRAIRAAVPLCKRNPELRTFASLMVCNLCGEEDDHGVFRECDENDEPLPGGLRREGASRGNSCGAGCCGWGE